MNVVVPLFLIAPLLVVPIGVRLLDAIAPGTDPLRRRPLVVVAWGGVLAVAFVLPAGALAAVLAVPWLVGSLVMASGIAMGVVSRPATIQSIAGLASAASVGFL
ncbi:MAG: YndJ family transporter, partial [Candidatus Limnocylindrales bacterium]